MPQTVACPQCRQLLNLTEPPAAQPVRCPRCGADFTLPASAIQAIPPMPLPPLAQPIAEDPFGNLEAPSAPARPAPLDFASQGAAELDDRDPGWSQLKLGLTIIRISLFLLLGWFTFALLGGVSAALLEFYPFAALLGGLLMPVALLPGLAILGGRWVCIAAPRQSRVKTFMLTSAILTTLPLLASLLTVAGVLAVEVLGGAGRASGLGGMAWVDYLGTGLVLVILSGLVCGLAGEVLFFLALHGVARFFHNRGLQDSVSRFLFALPCVPLVSCGLTACFGTLGDTPGSPHGSGILIQMVFLGIGLFMGIWYLLIVSEARRTIERALARARRDAMERGWEDSGGFTR